MSSNQHPEHVAEQMALYAAGALSPAEVAAVEHQLASGSEEHGMHMAQLDPVIDVLAAGIPPVRPSSDIRRKLLESLPPREERLSARSRMPNPQVWKQWRSDTAVGSMIIHRAEDDTWEDTGIAGVRVKRLFVDHTRDQFTALVRMAPGTSYPRHRHNGPEECLVLEGELHVGETCTLRAGDYQCCLPGSDHEEQWTEGGCLLLIVSSLHDDMHDDDHGHGHEH